MVKKKESDIDEMVQMALKDFESIYLKAIDEKKAKFHEETGKKPETLILSEFWFELLKQFVREHYKISIGQAAKSFFYLDVSVISTKKPIIMEFY